MPSGKKNLLILSFFFIACIFIGLIILGGIFRSQTNQSTHPIENSVIPETTDSNITKIFADEQKGAYAPGNIISYGPDYVPLEIARMHAEVELARVMYGTSVGLAGTNFTNVVVYQDPVIVYDNSGNIPRYYKFYAGVRGFENILLVTPATKTMGFSGGSSALGTSDDISDRRLLQNVQDYYDEHYPGFTIRSVKFIASDCWGEIIKLDVSSPLTEDNTTIYLDYGVLRDQKNCSCRVNTSINAIPDRIAEWETGDRYYRSIRDEAINDGINLSEPLSWHARETMKGIFQSVVPPRFSTG
jgi:hypothetical protein